MKGWIRGCAGLLAGSLCCGLASATTHEVDCKIIGPTPTELNGNLVCGKFQPPAGQTVTAISIDVIGNISGIISLTNNSDNKQTATATTTSQFSVRKIAGKDPGDAPESGFTWTNPLFTASFTTGLVIINPGATVVPPLEAHEHFVLGPDTTQFDPYVGAGSFDIAVATLTGFMVTGGGGLITAGQKTNADATAKVFYTFSPVPEPGTLSLIAVGVLALGALRRRAGK